MSLGHREISPEYKGSVQKGHAANLCYHLVSQDTEMTKEELTPHSLFWVLSHVLVFIALPLCAASAGTGIPLPPCPAGREGHVFFKLSISSVTVSISGLTPLCFFHEGLAFTLSLIMLSYDNRIKRKNTESCPSGVLYARPNKQLVLGIVLQLACPFYTIRMLNFNQGAVWPQQPSPEQQPSAVKGSLCYGGVRRVESLQGRQHPEKTGRFCPCLHLWKNLGSEELGEIVQYVHGCVYITTGKREFTCAVT